MIRSETSGRASLAYYSIRAIGSSRLASVSSTSATIARRRSLVLNDRCRASAGGVWRWKKKKNFLIARTRRANIKAKWNKIVKGGSGPRARARASPASEMERHAFPVHVLPRCIYTRALKLVYTVGASRAVRVRVSARSTRDDPLFPFEWLSIANCQLLMPDGTTRRNYSL